ncbi:MULTISPECIES: ABC transporter ATP-binding protein [Paenarthrobacter]|uniref:ABC transporter ATP-binding protein n=1 Tax=Paenarthrobacter TaxID=1742992 RepID=UPI00074D3C68|nr:ABC transporter ATP-binding protein [Paenarthrobacter ureafaciens]AMB39173.1 mannosyltransferase [Arthrobacter sp. ATCC 21022]KUR64971.1 mannosyltransferase [Arthrobacter sp. ATCC 21022]RWW95395.1 ABC transporter ATP-binding protein [Paenarthrobacter ureafaciens]
MSVIPESPAKTGAEVKVDIRGLNVEFKLSGSTFKALDGIDLSIRRGEFLVIVGPSGCGKTTLLRVLAGLEEASGGDVRIFDDEGGQRPESAMVFQEHGVFPWMTVRENVGFGLKASGLGRQERRGIADEYIERVGLAPFAKAYPHQLSGGMRQRVSVARAFATDAQMLLMDEPFAALDEQTKLVLQELLLRIWQETSKTVLYVTHSLDEALVLGDRIVVMSGRPGAVKDVIDVASVFQRPRKVADVRSDQRYGSMFGRIWGQLRQEDEATE